MTPRAEIRPQEKFPLQLPASQLLLPGAEIQTLLTMSWLWPTKLQRSHCGVMIMQLSRNLPSEICWKSTLWSAWETQFAGRCLTRGTSLQNYLRVMPGEAAGCQLLLILCAEGRPSTTEAACAVKKSWALEKPRVPQEPVTREAVPTMKSRCRRSCLQQEPGSGEAVYTEGAGRGRNHSHCSSLALEKLPTLQGPGSREDTCAARVRCQRSDKLCRSLVSKHTKTRKE